MSVLLNEEYYFCEHDLNGWCLLVKNVNLR